MPRTVGHSFAAVKHHFAGDIGHAHHMPRPIGKPIEDTTHMARTLSTNLHRLLKLKDWTVPELAQKSGVSTRTVRNMVNAVHDTQLGNVVKVAEAFGVPPWSLILESEASELTEILYIYVNTTDRGRLGIKIAAEGAQRLK